MAQHQPRRRWPTRRRIRGRASHELHSAGGARYFLRSHPSPPICLPEIASPCSSTGSNEVPRKKRKTLWVEKQDIARSSQSAGKIVQIITSLDALDLGQQVRAIEFMRLNPDAQPFFLALPLRARHDYLLEVLK